MPINSKIPDYSDDFDFESRITGAEFSGNTKIMGKVPVSP